MFNNSKESQNAIDYHGYKWMSWIDIPVKSTANYPQEQRIRQLVSPDQMEASGWQEYWKDKELQEATGDEPLAYAYCSSGGGIKMPPTHFDKTKSDVEFLRDQMTVVTHNSMLAVLANLTKRGSVGAIAFGYQGYYIIKSLDLKEPQDPNSDYVWHVSVYRSGDGEVDVGMIEKFASALVPACKKWSDIGMKDFGVYHIWGVL